jgi:deoxyribose-phosphate aldolase
MTNELIAHARMALACLDLTSLNDGDTEADIAALCAKAQTSFGPVAAVCVWPRLAAFARAQLPPNIRVAAVANFPVGSADVARAVADTRAIVDAGAQEVDVVLPYTELLQGNVVGVEMLLQAVRKACDGLTLKVILETGALVTDEQIALASQISLDAGADFLKTSTGKIPVSATPAAATQMLQAITQNATTKARTGFKPSGGIRTVADAVVYMQLQQQHLGAQALNSQRFRIGASSILGDITAILSGQGSPANSAASGY